jgi:hypothetical protein
LFRLPKLLLGAAMFVPAAQAADQAPPDPVARYAVTATLTPALASAEGLQPGPVAEDFKAAFGLAGDGQSIATVDADGVALAAIQGVNAKLEARNAALMARIAALDATLLQRQGE